MVTVHKMESENKEIQDKTRARVTVGNDLGEGMAELGQQIAKLMAAWTKARQGNNPSSVPNSPWERGCGRGCNTPSHPNSHNGRSGPGQTTPIHSLPTGHGTGGNGTRSNGQSNQWTSTRREGTANRWDPNSFQCFRCQGWDHMARECPTPALALNKLGGNCGNVVYPLPAKVTPANSRPHPFPAQPQTSTRAAQQTGL